MAVADEIVISEGLAPSAERELIEKIAEAIDAAGEASGLREESDRLRASLVASEANRSAIEAWAHVYGDQLCPGAGVADTYGNGVRACKQHVLTLLQGKL